MMAASGGASFFTAQFSPTALRSCLTPSLSNDKVKWNPVPNQTRPRAVSTEQISTGTAAAETGKKTMSFTENGSLSMELSDLDTGKMKEKQNLSVWEIAEAEMKSRKSLKDFFEESKDFIRSDGGPPRWWSPLECGSRLDDSPVLLYLPGIDGVGLGLIRQHHSLGKLFDIWCLHIPVKDRTPFTELVKLVERRVKSEYQRSPHRPIYLVGESLGACLALSVSALNPDIDLVLILANPGTSFKKSQLASLVPLLDVIPEGPEQLRLPYALSFTTGDPLKAVMENLIKGVSPLELFGKVFQDVAALSSYLLVLSDMLPKETILWKLKLLKSASEFANSRLHAVNAQTLILSSGEDKLLPSNEEGERLHNMLPNCDIRVFSHSGHFLFLEDEVDLGTVIKCTSLYRRGAFHDYISDYIRPSPAEFKKIYESSRWVRDLISPVMLSTFENGQIVQGLAGIPSEGPVLFIGYHMLLGFELSPMVTKMFLDRNILMRGIAHPSMFRRLKEGLLPPKAQFDLFRQMGAIPVSGKLFYKLLSSKAHVLLYPGGVREACHRKGEEYKLFWPEQSEFVRMAATFGATIVPFGVVGEDDFFDVFFDYDDQMKVPFLRNYITEIAEQSKSVRNELHGEAQNQDMHLPGIIPKLPGRFYYYFGRPIQTKGREKELREKEKAQELYIQVKSEVEKCLAFLKEKRKNDPYRSVLSRIVYQANHPNSSEIPSFDL